MVLKRVENIRQFFRNIDAPSEVIPEAGLEYWRERIYNSMVSAMLIWGLFALIPSVWLSFSEGLYGLGVFDLAAYLFLVSLYFLRRHSAYTLRALLLILLGLSIGMVVFFATGDEGAGLFWMFAVPPFASLLLGLPWGLFFTGLNAFMFLGIGYLVFIGPTALPGLEDLTLEGWIVYGINFLAANAIVTIPLGALLEGLFRSAERQQTLQKDYQLLFEHNPLPMWVYDKETLKFLAVNSAAVDHYGYSQQEFLGMTIKDIRPVIEIPRLEKNLSNQADRQHSGPWKHMKKDRTLIDVEIFSHAIEFGNRKGRLILANDVTDLVRSESDLREREELYRILADNSQTLICTHDLDGNILTTNEVGVQLSGYSREQIRTMKLKDLLAPEWKIFLPRYLSRITRLGKARGLMKIQTAAGDVRVWEYNNILWADEKGKPIVRGMANDVTERLEAQKKLQRADQILQNVKSLVLVLDSEGSLIYVSPSAKEIIGYEVEELLGDGWWRLSRLNPIDAEGEKAVLRRVARGEIPLRTETYERPIRAKNGEVHWIEWQDSIGPNQTLIGVGRDITDRKAAEQNLRRRLGELEAIRDISVGLRSAASLEEMLPILMDQTLRVMNVDSGAIWLYHKENDEVKVAISRGYIDPDGKEVEITPEKPGTGLAGIVFKEGNIHVSKEYKDDPRIPAEIRERTPPGVGGISIPIPSESGIIGVLVVNTRLPKVLESVEVELLHTFAEIAGNAIQRSSLHEKTTQQLNLFKALSEIDRAILTNLDLDHNLKLLVEKVVEQLGVDAANIMLYDPVLQTLQSVQGAGFRTTAFNQRSLDLGEGYAGKAAQERRIVHVDQLSSQKDNPRLSKALQGEGFASYYGLPLIAKGELRGVLEVFHREAFQADTEWLEQVSALASRAALAIDTIKVLDNLERSNQDLTLSYNATIEGWSHALDLRDKETEGHSQRVTELGLDLAKRMGLSGQQLVNFRRGALLHDIGKMGVPDTILFKPGKLTDEEWVVMKQHTVLARDMLLDIGYLKDSLDIPYSHHERWDGSGYPLGLSGAEIPLAARIFAVADVFDALTSDRPYRKAWTKHRAIAYIRDESGKLFDPDVVKSFMTIQLATQRLQTEKDAML